MRTNIIAAAAAVSVLAFAGAAHAADLDYGYGQPAESAGPSYAPYTFAGWYFGATLGYGDADINFSTPGVDGGFSADGLMGGVIGGYNWQNGRLIYGIDADILGSDVNGRQIGPVNSSFGDLNWMSSLRGRIGVAIIPQMMVFATLGGAYADADYTVGGPGGGSSNADLWGFQVGAGAEVALDQNWSVRFDYQHTDFGDDTINFPGGPLTFDTDISTYRGSVSYRF